MAPNSAPGRRCASRLDHSLSVSIDRSPDIASVATTQSPAVKRELSPPAMPKLTIAAAPENTARLMARA
jgi:hypothetical protein